MMRLACLSSVRIAFFLVLSFSLIYGPVLSVRFGTVMAVPATEKPSSSVQPIKHPHKTDEVVVKFWPDTSQEQRDQVINAFAKDKKESRGGGKRTN